MKVELKNDEVMNILREKFGKDASFELYFNTRNKNGEIDFDVKISFSEDGKYSLMYPFLLMNDVQI